MQKHVGTTDENIFWVKAFFFINLLRIHNCFNKWGTGDFIVCNLLFVLCKIVK